MTDPSPDPGSAFDYDGATMLARTIMERDRLQDQVYQLQRDLDWCKGELESTGRDRHALMEALAEAREHQPGGW